MLATFIGIAIILVVIIIYFKLRVFIPEKEIQSPIRKDTPQLVKELFESYPGVKFYDMEEYRKNRKFRIFHRSENSCLIDRIDWNLYLGKNDCGHMIISYYKNLDKIGIYFHQNIKNHFGSQGDESIIFNDHGQFEAYYYGNVRFDNFKTLPKSFKQKLFSIPKIGEILKQNLH